MRHDKWGDARGMAAKLLGVKGDKILPDERDAQTQDFVMINHPVFFANDPKRYFWLESVKKTIPNFQLKDFHRCSTPSVDYPLLLDRIFGKACHFTRGGGSPWNKRS